MSAERKRYSSVRVKEEDPGGKGRANSAADEDRKLCKTCSTINLDKAFGQYVRSSEGRFLGDIGMTNPQARNTSCPLCRLVANVLFYRPRSVLPPPGAQVYLKTAPATQSISGFDQNPRQSSFGQLRRNSVLRICWRTEEGHGSICDEHLATTESCPDQGDPPIVCRQLDPFDVDFGVLRGWLNFCDTFHRTWCQIGTRRPFPTFRVIDCKIGKIIPAPEKCLYCALSYVWGTAERTHETEPPEPGDLPKVLPSVIRDALIATQKLGYQYLWVDKYCINQDDLEDKIFQINNMDLVYNKAQVTIIASAGKGSDYGLPGVGERPRTAQPSAFIKGRWIVSSLPEPRFQIRQARWSTRGWTYQEAALSPRRLFFTDQQVYFECDSMYCMESIHLPLEHYHTKDGDYFRVEANWNMMCLFNLRYSQFIDRNIIDYSQRSLTYQSDAVNGILGTLKYHERQRSTEAPSHLWGIPLQVHWPAGASFEHPQLQNSDITKSSDAASMDFVRGLCWYLEHPGVRRKQFPSWSWAGWIGKLSDQSWERRISQWTEDDLRIHAGVEVIAQASGSEPSIEVYVEGEEPQAGVVAVGQLRRDSAGDTVCRLKVSPYLRVTATFVQLSIIQAPSQGVFKRREAAKDQKAEYVALLTDSQGVPYYSPFFLCGSKDSDADDFSKKIPTRGAWKGIITGYSSNVQLRSANDQDWAARQNVKVSAPFIIVLEEGDGSMCRIGDVDLHWLYTCGTSPSEHARHVADALTNIPKNIETTRIG